MRALLLLLTAAPIATAQTPPPALVLTHANVIDGIAPQPLRDVTVVIRDGKIESVGPRAAPPAGATVIDVRGRWVLPGLIDLHAHIADLTAARTALASGVTTVRTLGVDHFADIGLRELHRGGAVDIPDVLAAGYHVRPRPSEALFLDVPQLVDLLSAGVSGADNVRRRRSPQGQTSPWRPTRMATKVPTPPCARACARSSTARGSATKRSR